MFRAGKLLPEVIAAKRGPHVLLRAEVHILFPHTQIFKLWLYSTINKCICVIFLIWLIKTCLTIFGNIYAQRQKILKGS